MKIENQRADLERAGAARTEATNTAKPADTGRPGATDGPDQVRVSSGAQLASTAASAAERASDVRPEVVERAKAAMARGEVGNDPERLADALIDRVLGGD
jgi:flagellar biosynthesis anti-sigma factor FlgM